MLPIMRAVWLSILAPLALAASNAQGDYSVSGTVRNSMTGEPIRGAVVTLITAPDVRGEFIPDGGIRTTISGSSGEYSFSGLANDQYNVTAQKPGFIPANYPDGDAPEASSGSSAQRHADILLAPLGVIEGTIVNQYGDPQNRVSVALFQLTISEGERNIQAFGLTKTTDDLGQYRFWDLQPGKYYLKVMNRAGGTHMYVGDGLAYFESWEGFHPVYFGGAADIDSATPVTIDKGSDAHADFKLTVEPAYRIRGSLENFTPHQTVTFELIQGEDNVAPSRVSLNGGTGQFEIVDVPSGQYLLRATQGIRGRAEIHVTVSGADLMSVSAALLPPATVKGTVRTIGSTPDNPSPEAIGIRTPRPGCSVALRSGEKQIVVPANSHWAPEFSIPNVFAGEYRVRVDCVGGYPLSVTSGSTDLLSTPVLTIQPGSDPPPIEIVMKAGGGSLHGKITTHPDHALGAILVPAFSASTGPRQIMPIFSADENSFEFFGQNLAPGDYTIYPVTDTSEFEYRNPAVLRTLTGGSSVRIEENKTTEVTLTGGGK